MRTVVVIPTSSGWAVGDASIDRITAIAGRFRQLLLEDFSRELNLKQCSYLPWMAVRSCRAALLPLIERQPSPPKHVLLLEQSSFLRLLANVLQVDGRHPLSAIVPEDIGAEILSDTSALSQWRDRLSQAETALNLAVPWMGNLCRRLLQFVVPIRHRLLGKPIKRGFSTPLCYGAIFLTFEDRTFEMPWAVIELAIDLAHELGHHVLHAYQTADRIISSDLTAPVYSGVKKTARPAIMSVHASMALAYMLIAARALQRHSTDSFVNDRLSRMIQDYQAQQELALTEIRNHCTFTALGTRILHDLQTSLKAPSVN